MNEKKTGGEEKESSRRLQTMGDATPALIATPPLSVNPARWDKRMLGDPSPSQTSQREISSHLTKARAVVCLDPYFDDATQCNHFRVNVGIESQQSVGRSRAQRLRK